MSEENKAVDEPTVKFADDGTHLSLDRLSRNEHHFSNFFIAHALAQGF